jgi:L-threonylcarbamoyladenylate synthase
MTETINTRLVPAEFVAIADAARCLAVGGLVAFPTETVYGLGADATNGPAVARLYAAKGRPSFNPLIAHVFDLAAARRLALFDAAAEKLAKAFWPGPLTLVLKKRPGCPVADLATAGLDSIAVRVPQHPVALGVLGRLDRPIVAPSANRSGHVSPTTAKHVMDDLGGRIDFILDGGPTTVGVESTIVGCLDRPTLLRPGGLPRDRIESVLDAVLDDPAGDSFDPETPIAPGMIESHYAPRARLRLDVDRVNPGEALLAFGARLPPGTQDAAIVLNLSPNGDLVEAATNLFSDLRTLDQADVATIAVMSVPQEGLGEAINDRLARAAAPREGRAGEVP